MEYPVIIEKGSTSYGAYVPDLPGCVAVGDSVEEVTKLIKEAIGMKAGGEIIPDPVASHFRIALTTI